VRFFKTGFCGLISCKAQLSTFVVPIPEAVEAVKAIPISCSLAEFQSDVQLQQPDRRSVIFWLCHRVSHEEDGPRGGGGGDPGCWWNRVPRPPAHTAETTTGD